MKPYASPYVAGVALGLVLLMSYVWAGRGLGASGAFASVASAAVQQVAPGHAIETTFFGRYRAPLSDWLVIEIVGVVIGGWLSAKIAGRARLDVERGLDVAQRTRLAHAFLGGGAMGIGAVLARGCTSGQALTGGALLSVGSWLFMMATFASAYALSPLVRRFWR